MICSSPCRVRHLTDIDRFAFSNKYFAKLFFSLSTANQPKLISQTNKRVDLDFQQKGRARFQMQLPRMDAHVPP
jgi:hypothetical protein